MMTWLLLMSTALAGADRPPRSPASAEGPYQAFGYPWENNRLGMERIVPAPWTPVVREKERLRVWGRTYELGAGGVLPVQVVSQGEPLFAEPPRLELRVNGETPLANVQSPEFTEVSPDRVRYRTVRERDGYKVEAAATLEYDGFLLVSLTVTPVRPATIERLTVELPWRSQAALLYTRYVNYDYDRQDVNPADFASASGRLDRPSSLPFNPAVWVGNHDVGAEWACETDEGWHPTRRKDAIVFLPGGAVTRMRMNVVTKPLEATRPYRFSFAIYPTPVKPLPPDWRNVRLVGGAVSRPLDASRDRMYTMTHPGFKIRYRGLPALEPVAGAPRTLPGGVRYMPYGSLYGMPARLPGGEWKDYAAYWQTANPRAVSRNPTWSALLGLGPKDVSIIHISVQPKSFQDFLIWQYAEALDKHAIDGLYWDFGSPHYPSRNPLHAGGEWAARGGQFYPLFAQRELMKRFWIHLKSRKPDFLMMLHQVQTPVVVSGFCDVALSGEALNRVFKAPHWTIDKARTDPAAYVPDYGKLPDTLYEAQYSQRRGFINMLLSQIQKWNDGLMAKNPQALRDYTRVLLARTVLYDIPVSYMRVDRKSFDEVTEAQLRFGQFRESRFVGPWASAPLLAEGGKKLRVSLYLPPRAGTCLMVLSNLGETEVAEEVRPHAEVLRGAGAGPDGPVRAIDARNGNVIPLDGRGAARVGIGANDFRMILWQRGR